MYKNNTAYLSPRYTKSDYWALQLSEYSDNEDFIKAIDMFSDRIKGRFLDQIDNLTNDYEKNGFSIMALECLLVETFAQFWEGIPDTNNVSCAKYKQFLYSVLHCCQSLNVADKFYRNIRCGILHQAQTKEYGGLTENDTEEYPVFYDGEILMVSVPAFVRKMRCFFDWYCNNLRTSSNNFLRENFVKKMDYICGVIQH